ncbi:MAG: hypothetical protein EOO16_17150 [Chitinophagaceae bacterium]|nr:MAG: hypothetical protein EOO16_17150 [Chitinophagaceae bacterium]
MRKLLLVLLAFAGSFAGLKAQTDFASFSSVPRTARLAACAAEVKADPFVATTVLTLEFQNPNTDTIEARYRFRLAESMAVTGFQLELNGEFRDGSIEERWKARDAYQAVTGQRIDPALLEMTSDHYYSLRIFPVAPGGSRRVRLVVQQALRLQDGYVHYQFPLSAATKVDRFSAGADLHSPGGLPLSGQGFWAQLPFRSENGRYRVARSATGPVSLEELSFRIPVRRPLASCSWSDEQGSFLLLHLPEAVAPVPGYAFVGFRHNSGSWLSGARGSNGDWSLRVPVRGRDTVQAMYSNGRDQFAGASWPLAQLTGCGDPSGASRLGALLDFSRIVSYGWAEQLRFGVRHGIVTGRTAYIVLERVEDYIRYQIRPPKELEQTCAEQGYVWKDAMPALQARSTLELFQSAAGYYFNRLRELDPQARPLAVRSLAAPGAKDLYANQAPYTVDAAPGALNEEVVVTALGMRRRPAFLSPYDGNVGMALAGKVAGLQVTSGYGDAPASILLRGTRSITGSNNPLVVINGTSIKGESLNYINPNDVERVDVLRPAAAAAIYGSEGVNGAIIIALKSGRQFYWGDSDRPYRLKNMPDEDYVQAFRDAFRNDRLDVYESLRRDPENSRSSVFYFDMAQALWDDGFHEEAFVALYNAAGAGPEGRNSVEVQRGIAYRLEAWGLLDDAIRVHRLLLPSGGMQAHYDLGLALYRAGRYQEALETFMGALRIDGVENGYADGSWKALMLEEVNDIVARYRAELDLAAVPADLLHPLRRVLRIQTARNDWSGWSRLEVQAPPGDNSWTTQQTVDGRNGRVLRYSPGGMGEYAADSVRAGTYRVRLQHFFGYNRNDAPVVMRVLYRSENAAGKLTWTVRAHVLNNQYGCVEIDEWKPSRKQR